MDTADFWFRLILVGNAIVGSIVAVLVFFWTRGRTSAVDDAKVLFRVEALEKRMERAGQQSSDLTDKVQVMVSRDEFQREHRVRSDQIGVLNANFGVLQLSQAKLEERVNGQALTIMEHTKILGDFRLGRREYDPTS